MSALSDVKVNGTVDFDGEPPDPNHLLRVYYGFTDANGNYESVPVATLVVSASSPKLSETDGGVNQQGTAKLSSVLQVLKDVELNAPFTVKAGEYVIAKAMSLIADHGLPTNNPDPTAYALKSDYTIPAEDANVLSIVNALLGFAGYSAAWVDANGVVQITPYEEPRNRETVERFTHGEDSVMYPEVGSESNWNSTPNVVRLVYSTDAEILTAYCKNVDPNSKASLVSSGGRERTLKDTVSELAGDTQEDRLENLINMAEAKLIDNSAEIEYAEINCAYLPIVPNDFVEIDYAGLDWKGAAMNYKVNLDDDSDSVLRIRRFTRSALKVEKGGDVLWTA